MPGDLPGYHGAPPAEHAFSQRRTPAQSAYQGGPAYLTPPQTSHEQVRHCVMYLFTSSGAQLLSCQYNRPGAVPPQSQPEHPDQNTHVLSISRSTSQCGFIYPRYVSGKSDSDVPADSEPDISRMSVSWSFC